MNKLKFFSTAFIVRYISSTAVSSRLQIQIPTELFKPNGYEHQEALFGIPRYGGSIVQRLWYPGDFKTPYTLCDDTSTSSFVNPSKNQPFILFIDRGGEGCTFVSKVRRAQHLGAAGVIIADDRCLCSDADCQSNQPCEAIEPIMADDGSGADITIPSFLMKKIDSDIVKSHLEAGVYIQVEMTWSLPAPDDRVEWSLWTTSIDMATSSLKADFEEVATSLGKHAYFTPYYTLFDGTLYGCTSGVQICGNLCSNQGRYCSPDPDSDVTSGLSGYDVTAEILRQKCIWLYYGGDKAPVSDQGIGKKWWEYVKNFSTSCGIEQFNDLNCVYQAMTDSGVDRNVVSKCMSDSGGLDGNNDNTILSGELDEQASKSVVVTPTIFVNNVVERGGLTVSSVLTMLCSGFAVGTEPDICQCSGQGSSAAVKLCMENGPPSNYSHGVSLSTVIIIVLIAIVLTSAVALYHYRKSQHAMREHVRGILAQYMPLEDMDAPNSSVRVPFMANIEDDDDLEVTKNSAML